MDHGHLAQAVIQPTMRVAQAASAAWALLAGPCLSILIFHRVHAKADLLFPEEPDAARFDRLMRFVAGAFKVMTLGEAVTALADGKLPPRALVITFDDGYADNAEVALPILLRHGLKASFFVSTGFLDGGRMWNDSVIACVGRCAHQVLDLESFGLGQSPMATLVARLDRDFQKPGFRRQPPLQDEPKVRVGRPLLGQG